jgi:hypothetical protein
MVIYAQIKQGTIWNVISLESGTDTGPYLVGYDYLIDITSMSPQPSVGWLYDGTSFSPPPPPSVDPLFIPMMSQASRNLISPSFGMLIGNTDSGTYQVVNYSGVWVETGF